MTTQTFAFAHIVTRHLYLDGHWYVASNTIPEYLTLAQIEISRLDFDHAIGHLTIASKLAVTIQNLELSNLINAAVIQCAQGRRRLESKIGQREDSASDNRRARAES